VALHGKGDRPDRFEREAVAALPAGWALLVPSAPIPRDRAPGHGAGSVGGSWYLYDGDTPLFRESLARAEAFVLRALDRARAASRRRPRGVRPPDFRRVALLGFSQGAYLAGVLAVRRPRRFRAAVLVGGRLKHEMLAPRFAAARAVRLLALHGSRDEAVRPAPAREGIEAARAAGLEADFRAFDAGHEFTPAMGRAARRWLAREVPEGPG
jgi:predicted esterase